MIVVPWKFDVLKTTVGLRNEALGNCMLVLNKNLLNFQVLRQKHSIVFMVHNKVFLCTKVTETGISISQLTQI